MKKVYLTYIFCMFVMSSAAASDIGKALGKSDVSRLELIANNLNMITLIELSQEEKDKKQKKKGGDIENTFTRYSVSKDYRLIIEDFYSAPVTSVTEKECNQQLKKLAETDVPDLTEALLMISPVRLSPEQAQQISNEAHLVVYVQAKENSQLSLNCSS